jgi:signal transduction histidine kinase
MHIEGSTLSSVVQADNERPASLPPAFRRLVTRSVVLPLSLAFIVAVVFVWQVIWLLAADAAVRHCDQVIDRATTVQKLLVDMETGIRAFVITEQASFLAPYNAARQALDGNIQNLSDLVAGNQDQAGRVNSLREKSGAWRAYAENIKSKVGKDDEAKSVIITGRGKELMDSVRRTVTQIVQVETNIRDGQSHRARMMAAAVVGISVVLCLICGMFVSVISRRQLFAVAKTYTRALAVAEQREQEKSELLASERAARSVAEHASRMKDEFLATLSHELRTPLNAILGWAHLLRQTPPNGTRDPKDLEHGLDTIERNARAQTQLIEDLLDMSRIISGKLRLDIQRIAPISFIEAAIQTIRPAAEAKGIRIEQMLDSQADPISGDPNRLQQVIWNLLSNSVKFTPKGGKVQVVLQRVDSHLEISVADTGQGIKPEFLPYVFERFRQADASAARRFGGLGLGLALVKQLVELHGGSIEVKSPGEGMGATFVVELPLMVVHADSDDGARKHPKAPSAVPCLPGSPTLAGLKVLVVDDEPDARDLIKRVLEACEAEVIAAGSATEALGMIEQDRPNVLVSDIGMPGIDGYEFLQKVRAMGSSRGGLLPAVALTAFARSEDRTRTLMAGYQVHVSKPVEPAELVATIASVAGRTIPPV